MGAKTFANAAFCWRVWVILMVLTGLLCSTALADRKITGVSVDPKEDRVVITVDSNSPIKMVPLISKKGDYIGFQFSGLLTDKGRLVGIHSGRIYNVKYSNYSNNPPAMRVVVNTSKHVDYSTKWLNNKKSVEITVWKLQKAIAAKPEWKVQPVQPASVKQPERASVNNAGPEVKVMGLVEIMSASTQPVQPSQLAAPAEPAKPKVDIKIPTNERIVGLSSANLVENQPKVALNFLAADIHDVLKALSVQSEKNIVASKDVTGTITISLSNVTIEQALDYIAKLSGYSYGKVNDTYIVGTKDNVRSVADDGTESSTVEVVQIHYANADDIIEFLEKEYPGLKFTKGGGSKKKDDKDNKEVATVPTRGGVIIISGPKHWIDQAKALVHQIDESMKKMMGDITSDIYHIKYVDAKQLGETLMAALPVVIIPAPTCGFDLAAPGAVAIGDEGGATVSDGKEEKNKFKPQMIIISGPPAAVQSAMNIAEELDVKTPQIKIEAKITSLTETGEKKLGLSWDWDSFKFVEESRHAWARMPVDFAATLEALLKEGEGQLLAAPNIICLEGKPGVFFVGDEVHYIVMIQQTPTGQNVVTDKANVGVQLRVIGDVSPDGYITLNLHPEVSVVSLEYNTEAAVTLPTITRRFTDHIIRVKDGETIVIGGLIRDEELQSLTKVPILGDLPVLGKFFRHKHNTKGHSEVVMFITASVLND